MQGPGPRVRNGVPHSDRVWTKRALFYATSAREPFRRSAEPALLHFGTNFRGHMALTPVTLSMSVQYSLSELQRPASAPDSALQRTLRE